MSPCDWIACDVCGNHRCPAHEPGPCPCGGDPEQWRRSFYHPLPECAEVTRAVTRPSKSAAIPAQPSLFPPPIRKPEIDH